MVCQFVFNRIGDSLQFWQIPFTVTLIAGLCWVFVVIFNKTGNYGLKLYSFSLIFILIVQNRPLEMNEISGERKIFLENILKETGPEYFKFAFFTIPPPHMSFWLSYFHVGHPLSMLAPHVKYYRPVCLSVREFPKEKNSFLQNMLDNTVRVADFNVYVEAQIRNGKFISLRESQLSFIRENKIQFAVFTSGYHPDSILASHFLPKFISPDGYKFCEFIDQPEI